MVRDRSLTPTSVAAPRCGLISSTASQHPGSPLDALSRRHSGTPKISRRPCRRGGIGGQPAVAQMRRQPRELLTDEGHIGARGTGQLPLDLDRLSRQQGVRVDAAAALEEDAVRCGWIGQFGVTVKLIRLNSPLRRTVQ
jgi:hypothetical protein